jgi:uncharacterized protein
MPIATPVLHISGLRDLPPLYALYGSFVKLINEHKQFAAQPSVRYNKTSNVREKLSVTSIDQQFVEFIVKSLVSKPEAVKIERRIDEKGVLLELTVDPEDLGRVIGKRGATAQSVRTLLRALGTKNDARYNLKIVDVDRPGGVADSAADDSSDDQVADEPVAKPKAKANKPVEEATDEPVEEKDSVAARTRKELADMDDLDI